MNYRQLLDLTKRYPNPSTINRSKLNYQAQMKFPVVKDVEEVTIIASQSDDDLKQSQAKKEEVLENVSATKTIDKMITKIHKG